MIRFTLTGLLLWLLTSCSSTPPGLTRQAGEELSYVINTTLTLEPAERLGYLVQHFGRPAKESSRTVTNRDDRSQKGTIRTLEYSGVTLITHVVSATGEEHLRSVEVRTPAYLAPQGIRIGMPVADLPGALSVLARDAQSLTYMLQLPHDGAMTLTVWHDGDTVTLLTWEF